MKAKFKFAAIAVIVAVGATVGYNNQTKKSIQSDLALANVEALTYDEYGYDRGCLPQGDGCLIYPTEWHPTALGKDL